MPLILEFNLEYPTMNLELYTKNTKEYEAIKLLIWMGIIKSHKSYPVKWYKPTKLGTKVKCKPIRETSTLMNSFEEFNNYVSYVNRRMNINLPKLELDSADFVGESKKEFESLNKNKVIPIRNNEI